MPAIDADRAPVRAKALADIRATEAASLNTAGWIDQDRGIVRLPIDTAMQIYEQAAQNPARRPRRFDRARRKSAAPPPETTAPKPSAFE